jgi:hypothetical protein
MNMLMVIGCYWSTEIFLGRRQYIAIQKYVLNCKHLPFGRVKTPKVEYGMPII